jgi:hypothetical protein
MKIQLIIARGLRVAIDDKIDTSSKSYNIENDVIEFDVPISGIYSIELSHSEENAEMPEMGDRIYINFADSQKVARITEAFNSEDGGIVNFGGKDIEIDETELFIEAETED